MKISTPMYKVGHHTLFKPSLQIPSTSVAKTFAQSAHRPLPVQPSLDTLNDSTQSSGIQRSLTDFDESKRSDIKGKIRTARDSISNLEKYISNKNEIKEKDKETYLKELDKLGTTVNQIEAGKETAPDVAINRVIIRLKAIAREVGFTTR